MSRSKFLNSIVQCAMVSIVWLVAGCQHGAEVLVGDVPVGAVLVDETPDGQVANPNALRFYDRAINEIQLIGSHNSYKQAIDPGLLKAIAQNDRKQAMGLDYSHPSLSDQLRLGLRKFELDVFYDPQGGLYKSPLGLQLAPDAMAFEHQALESPGFKVMHIQDIDFRTHCARLARCLEEIVSWSDANQGHMPIFITINPKQGKIPLPGFVDPVPFDAKAFKRLDQEIRQAVGRKLYSPDDFRAGEATLPQAVERGWPKVSALMGKIIFVLDTGEALRETYRQDHPALANRAMFMNAQEGQAESAILIINDPVADFDRIQALVKQGYLVRTRSDADTVEARTGDTTRMRRAFDSGAQIISTDYYQSDPRFGTDFVVQFPDGSFVRVNPEFN